MKLNYSKSCGKCGKLFSKPYKWSNKQFDGAKFCSNKCRTDDRKNWKPKPETISRMKKARLGKSAVWNKGANNYFWKGGVTKKHLALRMSLEYKIWRRAVYERDNYTCIWCGYKGNKLNADHIKSFSQYPELRFAIDNGRTLCEPCHRTTNTYGKNK